MRHLRQSAAYRACKRLTLGRRDKASFVFSCATREPSLVSRRAETACDVTARSSEVREETADDAHWIMGSIHSRTNTSSIYFSFFFFSVFFFYFFTYKTLHAHSPIPLANIRPLVPLFFSSPFSDGRPPILRRLLIKRVRISSLLSKSHARVSSTLSRDPL